MSSTDLTTDDELKADLVRVREKLGHSPSRREYEETGNYSSSTQKRRFGSWSKAKETAGLEESVGWKIINPDDILDDLRRVASYIGKTPSKNDYLEHGKYSISPISNAFGSFNEGKEAARLKTYPTGGNPRGKNKSGWYNSIKERGSCAICNETRPPCLVFHHLPEYQKVNEMANMVKRGYTLQECKEEAEKCVLLCKNCHALTHSGNIDLEDEL